MRGAETLPTLSGMPFIRSLLLLGLWLVPGAGQAAEAVIRTYDVTGRTYAELIASMRENGPFVERTGRRHWGITQTAFQQEWSYQEARGRCELLAARTELDLTITLPEWKERAGASDATIRRWERLKADIVAHEERHAAIARDYLERLRAETDRPVTAPTCAALEAGLRARSTIITDRHREAQLEFDRSVGPIKLPNPRREGGAG